MSETNDLRPLDLWVLFPEIFRQAVGLPEHFEISHNRVNRLLISHKRIVIHTGYIAFDLFNRSQISPTSRGGLLRDIDQILFDLFPIARFECPARLVLSIMPIRDEAQANAPAHAQSRNQLHAPATVRFSN
jgi:hypothetical protein